MTPGAREKASWGAAFGAGLVFGVGLTVSGMTRPTKVIAFLDFFGGAWDPSLLFVMGGAVAVSTIAFRLILKRRLPILADGFALPLRKTIDRRLLVGAVIFGAGWGLGGFCPGPAIVSLAGGATSPLVFVAAMLAGMFLFDALDGIRLRRARASMPSISPEAYDDA